MSSSRVRWSDRACQLPLVDRGYPIGKGRLEKTAQFRTLQRLAVPAVDLAIDAVPGTLALHHVEAKRLVAPWCSSLWWYSLTILRT